MKIKELLEALKKEDPEMEIVLSKDAEGNNYSPMYDIGDGLYVADSTYSGVLFNLDEVEEAGEKAEKVLCFWPVN